jgi:hypothetical protein
MEIVIILKKQQKQMLPIIATEVMILFLATLFSLSLYDWIEK